MHHIQLITNNRNNSNGRGSSTMKEATYRKISHYDNDDRAASSRTVFREEFTEKELFPQKRSQKKKINIVDSATTSNYQPPPSFGSSSLHSRINPNIDSFHQLQPQQRRRKVERVRSDGQVCPSRRRDSGKDIQLFPAEQRRNSTGNMTAAVNSSTSKVTPTTLTPTVSSFSLSSSSFSCATGNNLYNYHISTIDTSTMNHTMRNTPVVTETIVDERDNTNIDNRIRFPSTGTLPCSSPYKYERVNSSLHRILSNMSPDSLRIIEDENDDEDEDEDEDKDVDSLTTTATAATTTTSRDENKMEQLQAIKIIQESTETNNEDEKTVITENYSLRILLRRLRDNENRRHSRSFHILRKES